MKMLFNKVNKNYKMEQLTATLYNQEEKVHNIWSSWVVFIGSTLYQDKLHLDA